MDKSNIRLKILIFGFTGMLGCRLTAVLSDNHNFDIYCAGRQKNDHELPSGAKFIEFDALLQQCELAEIVERVDPDFIINSLGFVKQRKRTAGTGEIYTLNSLFPKRLSQIIENSHTKLIHISTDCVFEGDTGNYRESDIPDSSDEYGISKFLGEVKNSRNTVTLRTSFIGHERSNHLSLLDWFIKQEGTVYGYKNAIYSGLTSLEISRIISEYVINNFQPGLYHLGGVSIDKFTLLNKIKNLYALKNITIEADYSVRIDRSLNSELFRQQYGYKVRPWDDLLMDMYRDFSLRGF